MTSDNSIPLFPAQPLALSAVDRLHLKNLYLCVRLKGRLPCGAMGYCYMGLFLSDFLELLKHLRTNRAANPQDFKGTVLVRSTDEPSPEIQAFMRLKFSFAAEDQPITLELSREERRHNA